MNKVIKNQCLFLDNLWKGKRSIFIKYIVSTNSSPHDFRGEIAKKKKWTPPNKHWFIYQYPCKQQWQKGSTANTNGNKILSELNIFCDSLESHHLRVTKGMGCAAGHSSDLLCSPNQRQNIVVKCPWSEVVDQIHFLWFQTCSLPWRIRKTKNWESHNWRDWFQFLGLHKSHPDCPCSAGGQEVILNVRESLQVQQPAGRQQWSS